MTPAAANDAAAGRCTECELNGTVCSPCLSRLYNQDQDQDQDQVLPYRPLVLVVTRPLRRARALVITTTAPSCIGCKMPTGEASLSRCRYSSARSPLTPAQ